jgi:hypothetical protein
MSRAIEDFSVNFKPTLRLNIFTCKGEKEHEESIFWSNANADFFNKYIDVGV